MSKWKWYQNYFHLDNRNLVRRYLQKHARSKCAELLSWQTYFGSVSALIFEKNAADYLHIIIGGALVLIGLLRKK